MTADDTRSPDARMPVDVAPAQKRAGTYWPAIVILVMLVAGFALTVLVFQPGYATLDARYVYKDAMAWNLGDWQSPLMGLLWRLIDPLAPGAWSIFLLIAALYWLGFGLLALTVARRATWLGLLTPLIALTPPAFFFVGMIWRDVLFAVIWLVAAVLPFAVAESSARARVPAQVLALLLIAFGVLLRPNSVFAAPFLVAYAIWPLRFDLKRMAIVFIPAALACIALVPTVYYALLNAKRLNPHHSVMVFDLGGITHFSGENQFPVQWSPAEAARLTSECYDPSRWDGYWYTTPCPFVMKRLEQPGDVIFGTPRLSDAWQRAVLSHPLAYLQHRTSFMRNFLARPNMVLPQVDWEKDTEVTYGNNPYLRPLLDLHYVLERTAVFRVGLWLVLAIAVGAAAWPLRATPAGAFAIGVTASAAVYVMTFFAVGVASDFRYAYWCVLASLAGAIAVLSAWRDRRALAH